MATPDVIENCNSASLNSQVSAVSCALDQLNKKFGSGSLKILQDGYVDITMGSLTDNYSSPWTVECWFYPTAVGSADGWLFNQDDNTDGSLAWYVRLKASSITLGIRGLTETSAVIIAYNEWHHLRVTHAGDKLLKLYLDGALLDSKTFATETDPRIRFGKPYTFTTDEKNRWYTGNIDEIAFTVLDSSNVAEYSGDTAPVPTEGYPDEGTSGGTGVVINGLFLSTSKPKDGDKGLLINNKFFIPFAESSGSGGTSAEYYKCASVDTSAKTWSGYKAVFDSTAGTWSFSDTVTEGLSYIGITPVVGKIYSADTTIQVGYIKLDGILNDETVKFLLYPKSSGTLEDISAGGNGVAVTNTGSVAVENNRIVFGDGKALTIPANTLPNDIFVSGSPFIIEFQGIIPTYTSGLCCPWARKSGSMYYNRLDMYLNTIEGDSKYGQINFGYLPGNLVPPVGAFTVGAEHVVAFEYDGSNTNRVYLDGVFQYSFTGTSYLPFRTYDFLIGHDEDEMGGSNANPFHGNMSYFRIRNVAPYQGASYTPEWV